MGKLQLINFEPEGYNAKALELLEEFCDVHECAFSRQELLENIGSYDVLITRLGHKIDTEMLDRAKNLKVIVTATTGLNHIDLEATNARSIDVLSLKGEQDFLRHITATAEHTWGLLLSLIRHIPDAFGDVRKGNWQRDSFTGVDLKDKTLGILGFGRLGRLVSEYANAFKMNVTAYDPYVEDFPNNVKKSLLEEVLKNSDVVTIHVPLIEETIGIYGTDEFALMKRGSYLINTSRGEVLNEEALLDALKNNEIAGAALDVLCGEMSAGSKLENPLVEYSKTAKNLIITPHIGGASIDSMRKTELFMAQKLANWYAIGPLII